MGFKENFIPNLDPLICPVCKTGLTIQVQSFYQVIKPIILFECKGEVRYNDRVFEIKIQLELRSFDKSDGISSIEIKVKRNISDDLSFMARLGEEQFNREPNIFEDGEFRGVVSSMSLYV